MASPRATASRAHEAVARRVRRLHDAWRDGPRESRPRAISGAAAAVRSTSSRIASPPDLARAARRDRSRRARGPLGAHMLGAPLLAHADRAPRAGAWRRWHASLVNGGNARLRTATWMHYLHAAYAPAAAGIGAHADLGSARTPVLPGAGTRRAAATPPSSSATASGPRRTSNASTGSIASRLRVVYYGVDASGLSGHHGRRSGGPRARGARHR